ncbi:MAG: CpsD/CapB family tyrosine-protein kinase, partial [Bacillota bacterium]
MASDNNDFRSAELITNKYPRSPASEAFRSLRTNLSFLSPDDPLRSILVTSSEIGDGKSMVIANLAVSLAQNNLKTILIDADIRKPMMHRFFEMTNHTGLSNILTNDAEYEQVIRETKIENVSLLSTGTIPPNPAELLSSQKMDQVIEISEEKADLVLIDTPPVGIVTDAVILSHKV